MRISRMPSGSLANMAPMPMMAAPVAQVATMPATIPAPTAVADTAATNDHMVQAPMVGTFYSAPAPGAQAFVQIGDEVKVGQVLCIIEAMKMMNQIESDRAGKVVSVLVQNGDPVEFGQPLFAIR